MGFGEILSNIINTSIMIVLAVISILIILRYIKVFLAKRVQENAKVADLYTTTSMFVSRYRGEYPVTNYIVKFETNQKVLTFFVSPFVYGSLSKGETGILTYQGEKYIDFK